MENIMKNIGVCVDVGEDGTATAYGEWDEERRASFISSILGGGDKKKEQEVHTCCMCEEKYKGFGNNARPVYGGRCCDMCNVIVMNARMGGFQFEEFKKVCETFPSQKKVIWGSLKKKLKSTPKGERFCPREVVIQANRERAKNEEQARKDHFERVNRHIAEERRLAKMEEERKVRDAEDTKKREEDFELRLKALEVKEAQRKEEEKREKEEKAKKAEAKRAETQKKQEEKQAKWKKQ
jgi:hypothetical protein